MKKKIALDVDGVLLDFYGHLMEHLDGEVELLDTWSNDYVNSVFKKVSNNINFWSTIPKLVSPKSITFDFDLYLTHIPPLMLESRIFNLKHLGFPNKKVVACENKADYCLENGIDILIDDKDTTVKDCREKGINGILVKPYYYSESYAKDLNPVRSLMEAKTQFNKTYASR